MAPPRRFEALVATASALVVGAFSAALLSWHLRAPPGLRSTGLFQGDMPTYLCYARMAAASPTLLSYAHPNDFREPPAPLLVNLPITLMGALLRALPSPGAVETVMRVGFGVAMLLALAALLRRLFDRDGWFWAAFALIALGGGATWLAALATHPPSALLATVQDLEGRHYWWGLTLLRNLIYPLELLYHALLILQLGALIDGRWWRAAGLFGAGALCNPFLAMQMLGPQLGLALLSRRQPLAPRVASFAVAAALAGYYGWLLPRDPVLGSFHRQHAAAYAEPLALQDLLLGHGMALLGLLGLAQRSFRRWILAQTFAAPILGLGAWTLLLTQHSRIPGVHGIQPMHFTRGYLALSVGCVAVLWLRHLARESATGARWAPRAAAALVALSLPDNALFVRDQWRTPPQSPLLLWPDADRALVERLGATSPPGVVLVTAEALSLQVCAFTQHRTLLGTEYTTPDHARRVAEMQAFRDRAQTATRVGEVAVDAVVVPAEDTPWRAAMTRNPAWRLEWANASWALFRRR